MEKQENLNIKNKILVIDDEEFIRELIKDILEMEEIETDQAANSAEALELIDNNNYSLIFLDKNLNDENIEELIENIREKGSKSKIVIITGEMSVDDDYLKKIGADDYLLKPFDFDRLIKKVKEHMVK